MKNCCKTIIHAEYGERHLMCIKEKIKKYIMVSRKNNFLWKCFINRNNREFVDHILDWSESPYDIQIHHYGEKNIGKIIYVITEQGSNWGFFAEFRAMLVKLLYADRMGLMPVIVFGDKFLYYEAGGINGENNAFRYYFLQEINDEDIYNSANVVWSELKHSHFTEKEYGNDGYIVQKKFIEDLSAIYRKYIKFNDETLFFLQKSSSELLKKRKVLGIHYRGTDFKKSYKKHPVPVEVEQIIKKAEECYDKNNYEAIFLATDDQNALKVFRKFLGDKLLYYKDVYRGEQEVSIAFSDSSREHHKYLLGREVLRDVYTLSICHGLICGLSQIEIAAQIIKRSHDEVYEDLIVINNGISTNDVLFV